MVCLMPVMITRKAAMVSLLVWLWQGVPCSSFQPRLPSIIRNAKALQSKLQQAQIDHIVQFQMSKLRFLQR